MQNTPHTHTHSHPLPAEDVTWSHILFLPFAWFWPWNLVWPACLEGPISRNSSNTGNWFLMQLWPGPATTGACGKLGFKSCLNGGDINPEWVEPSEKTLPLAQNRLTSCLSLDPKSYHWGVTAVFELFLMMQSVTYHILSDCANHSPPYMYHPGRKMCRIIRFS